MTEFFKQGRRYKSMAKVIVYHAVNEEEKEILIDIHEIQQECIREMKKEYPKYKVEIVDDHPL